jgi:hypothetical protein
MALPPVFNSATRPSGSILFLHASALAAEAGLPGVMCLRSLKRESKSWKESKSEVDLSRGNGVNSRSGLSLDTDGNIPTIQAQKTRLAQFLIIKLTAATTK